MLGEHTPVILLRRSMNELLRQLPNIREGTEEGFHQGRVAIRRVREVVAVVRHRADDRTVEVIEGRFRRAARVLGRVRDADVAQHLIHHLEARFPAAQSALGPLRSTVAGEQLRSRRRAIKELESRDLAALPHELQRALHGRSLRSASGWRAALREHIACRAGELRSAIDHAGGVYFPNRVHATRIAAKRFRYALELAKATRTWRMPGAIRLLKQVQSGLGEAHDREVLLGRLDELRAEQPTHAAAGVLEHFLSAEIQTFHTAYLECRPGLLAACDAAASQGGRWRRDRWVLVASVAVPSLLLAWRRRSAPAGSDDEDVVERRVRVTLA